MRTGRDRRNTVIGAAMVALLAGCSTPPTAEPEAVAGTPVAGESSPGVEIEPVEEEVAGVVEREWWKDLGLVVTPETVGLDPFMFGVNDIKIAPLPNGGYAAILASHSPYGAGPGRFHALESPDLVEWTEVARFDMEAMLEAGFYIGTLLALPDGALKMIGVSDRPGNPVLSSTSLDGGRTWSAGPGPLISASDFDHEVLLMSAAVLARPEGGWRMYINANDCGVTDLYGGDNCSGEALANMGQGVESVYSAVSDDLVTWTLEPGVRYRGSIDDGSIHHLDVWIDDDGRVRLIGHMKWDPSWIFPDGSPQPEDGFTLSQVIPSGALMELASDDGITFDLADYRDYRFPIADPQVVPGPDGSYFLLAGSQGQDDIVDRGDGEFDQRGGIRLFELVTIGWELDPIVPFPVVLQAPQPDQFDTHPFLSCFRIDVRGSGTVTFEVRAGGWGFTPGSAPPDLYGIIDPVVEAPGTVHIKRSDPPDVPDRYWPMNVVATDEDGVSWFVQPFPMQEPAWQGEVHGHDFDTFPCPRE